MQLTKSEITEICKCKGKGCEQVDDQSALLIHCKGKNCMYKVLYTLEHIQSVKSYCGKVNMGIFRNSVDTKHFISIDIDRKRSSKFLLYKYSRVLY